MTDSASDPGAILLFGVLSALVLIISWKRGFFSFPQEAKSWPVPIKTFHVVAVFVVYFGVARFITPLFGGALKPFFQKGPLVDALGFASWLNFLNSILIFGGLLIFALASSPHLRKSIWRRNREENPTYGEDVRTAALAWIVSFPLVLFLSQLFDYLTTTLFRTPAIPEQLAVYFLKMTFGHPLYLVLTIATIIILAPIIEETLFRGYLQSFIRQHLGQKQAIGITSLLFALFHYTPEQGLGNIPIIISLFALALFLGFIYEKRGSLAAPMTLHAIFNTISVLNLYFLGGFPKHSL